jgi:hypothetical protein
LQRAGYFRAKAQRSSAARCNPSYKGDVPTFKEPFPKSKPFKCCTAWHLRKSGNLLAIYDFLGGLTNGGKNPFYSSIRKVAIFFYGDESESSYESTRRTFRTLRKMGFLEADGKNILYVGHDAWAAAHPHKCQAREMFPWQESADPFIGAIWKLACGKIRVLDWQIVAVRKVATDEEFIAEFESELNGAQLRRSSGDWHGTAAKACFWKAYWNLKNRKATTVGIPA